MKEIITVIIPTTCESFRQQQLNRAIDSLLSQTVEQLKILVVINGNRFDKALWESISKKPKVEVIYQEEGSLPLALETARKSVETEFFCFLDDDDIYLDSALELRLAAMRRDSSIGIVATNGYNVRDGERKLRVKNSANEVTQSPLSCLVGGNWLASCGGLYRTSLIPTKYFSEIIHYYEWTHIAFRVANDGIEVSFLDEPTYEVNDTPNSLSKSLKYSLATERINSEMLRLCSDAVVRKKLEGKLAASLHSLSEILWSEGRYKESWVYHLKSVRIKQGWRYLLFTRKLLVRSLKLIFS